MTSLRDDLLTILQENICSLQFTKADGEERTMTCTLLPRHLPKVETSRHSPDVITVWDMDKAAWRSFRVDSFLRFLRIDSGVAA